MNPKLDWAECQALSAPPPRPVPTSRKANSPPPPPPVTLSASDRVQCRLLDPANAGLESCLIDAITDASMVATPYCPTTKADIPIGDLAFAMLADRHPGLWNRALPKDVVARRSKEGMQAFDDWVAKPANRQSLQKAVRRQVPAAIGEK